MNKENISYLDQLKRISLGPHSMHMPGHKGNTGRFGNDLPYKIDTTEVIGAINLHHPDPDFKAKLKKLSQIRGAGHSFYSINGSSGGILACLHALCQRKSKLLIERHAHQSVYHGAELLDLDLIYAGENINFKINVPAGAEDIERAFKIYPDIENVLITCPTYEGRRTDLKAIADICHRNKASLIVDQAHGAHLFYLGLEDAVEAGADAVIESLHKTLPALTSSSLVHISDRVDPEKIALYLSFFETSSPSHLLIASIDYCISYMEKEGKDHLKDIVKYMDENKSLLKKLKNITYFDPPLLRGIKNDPLKINIMTPYPYIKGQDLFQILYDTGFEAEMLWNDRILLMLGAGDEIADLEKLFSCLIRIDHKLCKKLPKEIYLSFEKNKENSSISFPKKIYSLARARNIKGQYSNLKDAAGKLSLENIWTYPPGSPLIVAGEKISAPLLEKIKELSDSGLLIHSDSCPGGEKYEYMKLKLKI